jgi:hypothetical protein
MYLSFCAGFMIDTCATKPASYEMHIQLNLTIVIIINIIITEITISIG